MREVLTVSINPDLKKKLNQIAKQNHVTKSDVVKKAVEIYILQDDFHNLREELIPFAKKAGYYTDEEIFNNKALS